MSGSMSPPLLVFYRWTEFIFGFRSSPAPSTHKKKSTRKKFFFSYNQTQILTAPFFSCRCLGYLYISPPTAMFSTISEQRLFYSISIRIFFCHQNIIVVDHQVPPAYLSSHTNRPKQKLDTHSTLQLVRTDVKTNRKKKSDGRFFLDSVV